MSDLMDRCSRALAFLEDASLPILEQIDKAASCLDGVMLSDLESEVRERFVSPLGSLTRVTSRYDLQEGEEMDRLSPADQSRYRYLLLKAVHQGLDAEKKRLIDALNTDWPVLPTAAILEIRSHRELMIPALIECIQSATLAVQELAVAGHAPFYALILLGEFQAKEALPVIFEAISLPGDLPNAIFNDEGIGDFLRRVLALSADPSTDLIEQLLTNSQIDVHVRWSAMEALVVLVGAGRLEHDRAVELIQERLRWAIDDSEGELATFAIYTLSRLAPKSAIPLVKKAAELGLIDGFLVNFDLVVQAAQRTPEQVIATLQHEMPMVIRDSIAELEVLGFESEPMPAKPTLATNPTLPKPHLTNRPRLPQMPLVSSTVHNSAKPGRNDPCNCGSGKKYKKCCG